MILIQFIFVVCFLQVLSLHHALPFPLAMDSTVVDTLLNLGDTLPWQSLTPGCPSNANCMAQSFIARGIPAGKLKGFGAGCSCYYLCRELLCYLVILR